MIRGLPDAHLFGLRIYVEHFWKIINLQDRWIVESWYQHCVVFVAGNILNVPFCLHPNIRMSNKHTAWDVSNLVNHGTNYLSTGAGVLPSTLGVLSDSGKPEVLSLHIFVFLAPRDAKPEHLRDKSHSTTTHPPKN